MYTPSTGCHWALCKHLPYVHLFNSYNTGRAGCHLIYTEAAQVDTLPEDTVPTKFVPPSFVYLGSAVRQRHYKLRYVSLLMLSPLFLCRSHPQVQMPSLLSSSLHGGGPRYQRWPSTQGREAKASENSDSPSILTPLGNLPRYPAWNEEQDPKNHEPVWETQIN